LAKTILSHCAVWRERKKQKNKTETDPFPGGDRIRHEDERLILRDGRTVRNGEKGIWKQEKFWNR
jgi:hypothetical protein